MNKELRKQFGIFRKAQDEINLFTETRISKLKFKTDDIIINKKPSPQILWFIYPSPNNLWRKLSTLDSCGKSDKLWKGVPALNG